MGPTDQVLPVSAVVSFLREYVEASELLSDLWITGEVSNYSQSQLGHRYFTLRDAKAAIRCVMFRDRMPRGFQLQDGDRIIAHGRVTVYIQRGELQFDCDFARPEGVGALAAKLEELRLRLEAEGLFDPARKRPLPRFPCRSGWSPHRAGLRSTTYSSSCGSGGRWRRWCSRRRWSRASWRPGRSSPRCGGWRPSRTWT